MALMTNGKKVVAIGIGGNEFYSIGENADGSISFNGELYALGNKSSDSITCAWVGATGTAPSGVRIGLGEGLGSTSGLTLKDLINKGKKIRLKLTFHSGVNDPDSSLTSGIIDLSKPDSNGHFNFQWLNGATSTNTYCYSNSSASTFITCSDAINAYSSSDWDAGHMNIYYSDES